MELARHILAAVGAACHSDAYVAREGTWEKIVAELPQPGIWAGWLAFVLFVVLGVTSNDASLRWLAVEWKTVQRLVYPAALLTLAHWVFESRGLGGTILHFAPLALLAVYPIGRTLHWWNFRLGGTHPKLRVGQPQS